MPTKRNITTKKPAHQSKSSKTGLANQKKRSIPDKAKYLVLVDSSDYSKVALRFACVKAKRTKRPVEMLYIQEPSDFTSLGMVEELAKKEARQKAEKILNKLAIDANKFADITPSLIVREGLYQEQIIAAIEEDKDISFLIAGAASGKISAGSKNKVASWIVSQLGDKIHIPVMIIPGCLKDTEIKELAEK